MIDNGLSFPHQFPDALLDTSSVSCLFSVVHPVYTLRFQNFFFFCKYYTHHVLLSPADLHSVVGSLWIVMVLKLMHLQQISLILIVFHACLLTPVCYNCCSLSFLQALYLPSLITTAHSFTQHLSTHHHRSLFHTLHYLLSQHLYSLLLTFLFT